MKQLARIVSNVAPTLGTLIGGPLGGAGGAVIGKIAEVLGAPSDDEEAIVQALATATPEQIARVKEIDADFKVRMKELGIKPHELEIEDRKDARSMAKSQGNAPQIGFTVMITTLIGGVVWSLFTVDMPPENSTLASMFLGVLIREWAGSMHFWFGTSIGSQKKDGAFLGGGKV